MSGAGDELVALATGLSLVEEGLWVSNRQSVVSFPEDGHEACLGVEDGSYWFQHRGECIADAVRAYPPQGPILDVGGGNGHVARGLVDAGFPAVVLEPGLAGAKQARARGLSPVICATLEEAGFPAARLPALGFFDVVEHVADDAGLLARARSLLIPGGRLYLTVPAFGWLWAEDDVVAGHVRRYTGTAMRGLLERTGFTVDFQTYLFAPLTLPLFLLRTLPSALGLRKQETVRQQMGAEHGVGGGPVVAALRRGLALERAWIRGGRSIPVGSSLLVVAHAN
ncbi:class I SAM-dependent methyltransferase [Myxococcus stipitatus]|uniref:class I SAM-dependent methyltransferase n=1 Tax=Myxococcus stipitatus TaxID=83455 RepID=UPI0030CA5CE1